MWTLLAGSQDWHRYQQRTATELGLVGTLVNWGAGPKEFPALVTTYMPPPVAGQPPKLVSAYVYREDAKALLPTRRVSAGAVGPSSEELVGPESGAKWDAQDKFNRWQAAYLLALVRELREVGALKAAKFEQSLAQGLQLVDECATADRDRLNREDKQDRDIINHLFPQE